MAETKITRNEVNFPTIVSAGSFTTGNVGANASSSVVVSIPTQTDTNYRVIMSTGVTAGAYWTFLVTRVQAKTTTTFTAQVWNNSTSTANATSFEYILVRE